MTGLEGEGPMLIGAQAEHASGFGQVACDTGDERTAGDERAGRPAGGASCERWRGWLEKLFGACFIVTLVLIALLSDVLPRYYPTSSLVPNIVLLCLAFAGCGCAARMMGGRGRETSGEDRACRPSTSPNWRFILPAVAVLLTYQLIVATSFRFVTGWDAGGIYGDVWHLHQGRLPYVSTIAYYSRYPNNLLLLAIERAVVGAIGPSWGFAGTYLLMTYACCLLSSAASVLTYLVVTRWAGRRAGAVSWVLFALLVGVSPWFLVVYSDSLTLAVPIAVLAIHAYMPKVAEDGPRRRKQVVRALGWLAIGLLTAVGYALKPQCVFVTAAVVLVAALGAVSRGIRRRRDRGAREYAANSGQTNRVRSSHLSHVVMVGMLALGFLGGHAVCAHAAQDAARAVGADARGAFSPAHFFMMGLNTGTDGGYESLDVRFSLSIVDPEARRAEDLRVAGARLRAMGPAGLAVHAARKQLSTWADGTFAWGAEGGFWHTPLLVAGTPATDFFRELYLRGDIPRPFIPDLPSWHRNPGRLFPLFATFEQQLWLILLVSLAAVAVLPHTALAQARPRGFHAALAAVLMLMAFELLFEARARYLYIYAPVMVACGVTALAWLSRRFERGPARACASWPSRKG